jgi:hypothetical protein
LERRDAVWQPQQADGGADPGALTALASAQPGISELCCGGFMGRRIPRDLRNIGWSFLFWVAVAAAAVVLVVVGSGCSGPLRVVARTDGAVSPGEGADRA